MAKVISNSSSLVYTAHVCGALRLRRGFVPSSNSSEETPHEECEAAECEAMRFACLTLFFLIFGVLPWLGWLSGYVLSGLIVFIFVFIAMSYRQSYE